MAQPAKKIEFPKETPKETPSSKRRRAFALRRDTLMGLPTNEYPKEDLSVDENRKRKYLAKKARPNAQTTRRQLRKYSGIDKLYAINYVGLMKFIPYVVLLPIAKALSYLFEISGMPVLRKVVPWRMWADNQLNTLTWLPVAEEVKVPEGTPVPLALLDVAIETAAHRFVIDECFCRKGLNCKQHPHDIGCLVYGDQPFRFIGDMGGIGREIGIEEAKKHARKAIADGLVPVFGKARVDCFLFGFRDRSRMLATCFCCDCCCILANYSKLWSVDTLNTTVPRLEGTAIRIDEKLCTGCGQCVEKCVSGGVKLKNHKAVITEKCRICSRCLAVCPNNAIEIKLTDPYWMDKTFDRVLQYVEWREGHSPMKLLPRGQ